LGGNLACFTALRGNRVAWFSAEMTAQECLTRAIAAHGDIPFDWVEQPNDKGPDAETYWARQSQIMKALTASPLLIDDTPAITIAQVMARARREHLRAPLRLIVIDHMHDMGTDPRAEIRHEYGRIAQGAKTLAKELDCPVVLLAQLNRNLSGRAEKRPTLTDLRDSGEIEQKADVVLFLHREDYHDSSTHMKGVVELIPAKGRNIRTDSTVYLSNRYDRMRLDDWDGCIPAASHDGKEHARPTKTAARGYGNANLRNSWAGSQS
jgi:replicative DNA helicase